MYETTRTFAKSTVKGMDEHEHPVYIYIVQVGSSSSSVSMLKNHSRMLTWKTVFLASAQKKVASATYSEGPWGTEFGYLLKGFTLHSTLSRSERSFSKKSAQNDSKLSAM